MSDTPRTMALCEAIGLWSVHVGETGELAPSKDLSDRIDDLLELERESEVYQRFYEARAAFDAMNPTEVSADVYLNAADELRAACRAVKEMRGG